MKLTARDLLKAMRQIELEQQFRFAIHAISGDHIYQITTLEDPVIKDIFAAIASKLDAVKLEEVPLVAFDFEAIYALYPKKIGKKKGLQICENTIRTQEDYDSLKRAVGIYTNSVMGREPQFIKQFDTFMRCWEDFAEPICPGPTFGEVVGEGIAL